MSPDEKRRASTPAAEAAQITETVRRLILMRETGPKSAAWHRARVQTIWRLQQQAAEATYGLQRAQQRQQPEAEHDHAAEQVDPAQPGQR